MNCDLLDIKQFMRIFFLTPGQEEQLLKISKTHRFVQYGLIFRRYPKDQKKDESEPDS